MAAYGWGCLGGAIAAVIGYVLPELANIQLRGKLQLTGWAVVATLVTVVVLTAIAGVVCLIPAHTPDRGHAIVYGLGAQGIFKGFLSAGKDALRPLAS
jgi:hypothetical protein